MFWIAELIFGLSTNLDNFTVAVTFGIRKIKINLLCNILIAIISGLGTYISMSFGYLIGDFFPSAVSNFIGSAILIIIGICIIKDSFKKSDKEQKLVNNKRNRLNSILKEPETADLDSSGVIDIKETVLLAFALTLNNFGLGIGSSITGLNILVTTISTFAFSILSIIVGYSIGKSCIPKPFCKYTPFISGLIIIALGFYEMLI